MGVVNFEEKRIIVNFEEKRIKKKCNGQAVESGFLNGTSA